MSLAHHAPRRLPRGLGHAWIALVAIGVVRLLAVVLAEPLVGYANQFDMARTSACVDLWPALPAPQRHGAHQSAPVAAYASERVPDAPCYPSTVVAFAALAKGVAHVGQAAGVLPPGEVPLQLVGLAQALALILVVLAFCHAERGRSWARLAHAAIFAVVLADPANTLWANTLYTEFATMIAAYAAIGWAALAPSPGRSAARTLAGVAAIAALGLSRQQYLAFAAVPLILAMPRARVEGWGRWLAAAAALAVVALVQADTASRIPSIRAANNHDFWLGAVLPATRDEPGALDDLGLPASCRDAIGSNWYVGMGAPPQSQCPEVEALGRVAFLRLAADDPGLPLRVLMRGLPEAQAWWQHHLGSVAGESFADFPQRSSWTALSIANVTESWPFGAWLLSLATLAAAFVAGAAGWLHTWRHEGPRDGFGAAVLGCASLGAYAIASAVFGDGYVEVSRHAILVHGALASLALLAVGYAVARITRATAAPRAVSVAAVLVLIAGFGFVLADASRRVPMARGVVDLPATRVADGDVYALRGWALDPYGVRQVRVGVYDGWDAEVPRASWTTTATRPTGGTQGPSLARYFPTYPDAGRGGFALDVPVSALAGRTSCLRVHVENSLGIVTEIDRRCVRTSP